MTLRITTLAACAALLLGAATARASDDDTPPPLPAATPPPPAGAHGDDAAAAGDANPAEKPTENGRGADTKPVRVAPLALPPDTEQADSGDNIGFVNVRFGVVVQGLQDFKYDNTGSNQQYLGTMDTKLQALQLRAFGQLPLLEDSFFLISARAELSPRITFAMFQVPLGRGHYININSGGGSLSNDLIVSAAKQPLLEPAFWMRNAFELGNGAAVEAHGPIGIPSLRYRAFLGGGAGQSTGNVGGQRITFNNDAFTYSVGGQLQATLIGYYDRFDSPFLYRPVPLALGMNFGVKYDQRAQQRFPAADFTGTLRWGRFELIAENYTKAELDFGRVGEAYVVRGGVLIVPEWFFVAADFGQFMTTDFGTVEDLSGGIVQNLPPPAKLETDLKKEVNETDFRVAAHLFFWRSNGVLSVRYTYKLQDRPLQGFGSQRTEPLTTHEVWLLGTMRF